MGNTTSDILASARDLYLEEGLQGISMRKVASRVGITATALYRHFDSKEDMLDRVLDEGVQIISGYFDNALTGQTPEMRLFLAGEAYVDFAIEHPRYYEMLFLVPGDFWRAGTPAVETPKRTTDEFLAERVRECMECGFFKQGDVEVVSRSMWALTHGLVSLYLSKRISCDPIEFRKIFISTSLQLFDGLRA